MIYIIYIYTHNIYIYLLYAIKIIREEINSDEKVRAQAQTRPDSRHPFLSSSSTSSLPLTASTFLSVSEFRSRNLRFRSRIVRTAPQWTIFIDFLNMRSPFAYVRFFITIFIDSSFACYFIVITISIFNKIITSFGRKMRARVRARHCATSFWDCFILVNFIYVLVCTQIAK